LRIAASLFTSLQTGILDPIPLLVRSLAVSILPGINFGLRTGLDFLYGTNIGAFQWAADAGYRIFGSNILSFKPQYYHFGFVLGIIFLTIAVLNRFITRFWCRGVCPLGAHGGAGALIFGMEKNQQVR
jgi:hypothetical protein